MEKPIIIFGSGSFSELMTKYIERFSDWKISCYTVDDDYCNQDTQCGKRLIKSSEVAKLFPPDENDAFITIGYSNMGQTRQHAFEFLKSKGYSIRNFIHPQSYCYADMIGEGNIILEDAVLGIGSSLGNANLIWGASNIAHDCKIGSFCTTCANCTFGGFTEVEDNCFFGMNATIRDHIKVAHATLVSAGVYVSHDTQEYEAYMMKATAKPQVLDSRKVMRFL